MTERLPICATAHTSHEPGESRLQIHSPKVLFHPGQISLLRKGGDFVDRGDYYSVTCDQTQGSNLNTISRIMDIKSVICTQTLLHGG